MVNINVQSNGQVIVNGNTLIFPKAGTDTSKRLFLETEIPKSVYSLTAMKLFARVLMNVMFRAK